MPGDVAGLSLEGFVELTVELDAGGDDDGALIALGESVAFLAVLSVEGKAVFVAGIDCVEGEADEGFEAKRLSVLASALARSVRAVAEVEVGGGGPEALLEFGEDMLVSPVALGGAALIASEASTSTAAAAAGGSPLTEGETVVLESG